MNATAKRVYGSYRFESSFNLTDEHLTQLISIFKTPTQAADTTLEGRVSTAATRLTGIGPVIVKHYRRGGVLGHFVKRTYLKWGKTRGQAEYAHLRNARDLGISVPEPIACAYTGQLFYEAWLITREIANQQSLARLGSRDEVRTETAQKKLIDQIAILIDNGIYHTDLHPGNVLVDADNRIFIIDFDKAAYYGKSKNSLRRKYLQRWNRAVKKHSLPEILFLNNSAL